MTKQRLHLKDVIWESLLRMMVEEKILFSKVSVARLCVWSHIHRSTFYEYFSDKIALLEYGVTQFMVPYYKLPIATRFMRPFQDVDRYYQKSIERQVIEIQSHDPQFSEVMTNMSKKYMIDEIHAYLKTIDTVNMDKMYLAHHHINSIFTLSDWNQRQPIPLTNSELDMMFMRMVVDPIIKK
ncbi:hypothetical protein G7062_10945 [Erysipelothrix sp. HDW6C]|uniref:hypothetical protein n=1 Tax=Erysipelothrix sp. HDW6C TaxID=2714930 RepID=UPI0014073116|nr:hypothetical protein [Erysipelothrix sp. HDW6C]QIK70777.1 hypothetical protein G7062_10945 [Erysipelothrix sp. HDW6C]